MKDKPQNTIPVLAQRLAYQYNQKIFKTPTAAAKNLAWAWIFSKYAVNEYPQTKEILGFECDCGESDERYDYGDIQYRHEACPLHNRKTGYFKRLHDRLVKAIVLEWSKKLPLDKPDETSTM